MPAFRRNAACGLAGSAKAPAPRPLSAARRRASRRRPAPSPSRCSAAPASASSRRTSSAGQPASPQTAALQKSFMPRIVRGIRRPWSYMTERPPSSGKRGLPGRRDMPVPGVDVVDDLPEDPTGEGAAPRRHLSRRPGRAVNARRQRARVPVPHAARSPQRRIRCACPASADRSRPVLASTLPPFTAVPTLACVATSATRVTRPSHRSPIRPTRRTSGPRIAHHLHSSPAPTVPPETSSAKTREPAACGLPTATRNAVLKARTAAFPYR